MKEGPALLERTIQIPSKEALLTVCSVSEAAQLERYVIPDVERPDDLLLAGFFKNALQKNQVEEIVGHVTPSFAPNPSRFNEHRIAHTVHAERESIIELMSRNIGDSIQRSLLMVLVTSLFINATTFDRMSLALFLSSEFSKEEMTPLIEALATSTYLHVRKFYGTPDKTELQLTPASLRRLQKGLLLKEEVTFQRADTKISPEEVFQFEILWLSQVFEPNQIMMICESPNYSFSKTVEMIRLGFSAEEILFVSQSMGQSLLDDLLM